MAAYGLQVALHSAGGQIQIPTSNGRKTEAETRSAQNDFSKFPSTQNIWNDPRAAEQNRTFCGSRLGTLTFNL